MVFRLMESIYREGRRGITRLAPGTGRDPRIRGSEQALNIFHFVAANRLQIHLPGGNYDAGKSVAVGMFARVFVSREEDYCLTLTNPGREGAKIHNTARRSMLPNASETLIASRLVLAAMIPIAAGSNPPPRAAAAV